ncbi:MAG: hypothetical protein ACR2OM_07810, partial [Aestuariivirgaceae bacterium]
MTEADNVVHAMRIARYPTRHMHNPNADAPPIYGEDEKQILSLAAFDDAWAEIRSWPNYHATPLV